MNSQTKRLVAVDWVTSGRFRKRSAILNVGLLLAACCLAGGQIGNDSAPSELVYKSTQLAFRYVRPSAMRDKTARLVLQFEDQWGTTRKFRTLLAMSSGPDSSIHSWRSVTVVMYPRNGVSEPDDMKAAAQVNAWIAHSRDSSALPKSVVISGQSFTASVFGLQEGPIKKGAVVFTTVRKGMLLSFAFVANSPDQLKALTETMKTVEFF